MTTDDATGEPADRMIVYVDGFNLYHGLRRAAGHELLWLDVVKLAQSLRPRAKVVQVKYFTAMVLDEPEAQGRQDRYLSAMAAAHPGVLSIIKGRYMRKPKECRACGANWTSYEEKQTDVNIAVHLVADAAATKADTFMIISGDTDVIPAVKMAKALHKPAYILAQFPPGRSSIALSRMLPDSREITATKIRAALLPDVVTGRRGAQFSRPEKWTADASPTPSAQAEHSCGGPSPRTVANVYRKRSGQNRE